MKLRETSADDLGFIMDSWLNSLRGSCGSPLPNDLFFPAHRELIVRMMKEPTARAKVMVDDADDNNIMGYAFWIQDILVWVYVKGSCRRKGVARALLSCETDVTTFGYSTYSWRKVYKKLGFIHQDDKPMRGLKGND